MVPLACAPSPAWRRRIALAALALTTALTQGCSDLPVIASSGCGNRVVESSEDCDEPTGASAFTCAQPGEVHACRYLCVRGDASAACPSGYACGTDGLCRTSAGDFVSVGRPIEAASATLAAGDFDGDGAADLLALGRVDVLGRSAGQVVFFSDATRQASLVSLPGQLGAPVVGHFSTVNTPAGPQPSPYAGVALLEVPGIITLIGRRDRQFFPRAYPTFAPPLVQHAATYAFDLLPTRAEVTVDKNGESHETLLNRADEILLHVTRDGQNALITPNLGQDTGAQADDPGTLLQLLPAGPQDLLDDLRVGRFDESLPCPSLLFAFRKTDSSPEPSLFSYVTCKLTTDKQGASYYDWTALKAQLDPIALLSIEGLSGPLLQGPPMVVDLDGDQHLDLLASVAVTVQEQGVTSTAVVAYAGFGDGKGGLSAPVSPWLPDSPRKPGLNLYTLPGEEVGPAVGSWGCGVRSAIGGILAGPLAAGDLDGDGRVDFVTEQGVCTSHDLTGGGAGSGGSGQAGSGGSSGDSGQPGVRYRRTISPLGTVLASAQLVDLDANGHLDVVAIPQLGSSLIVFLNQGNDSFTEVDVPLNGPPSRLRVGDFDGDGVGDVAFVEGDVQIQSNASASGDALAVLFGSRDQAPSTVVRMGRFDRIETIGAGRTALLTDQSDAASDLGVASLTYTAANPGGEVGISLLDGSSDRAMRSPAVIGIGLSYAVAAGRFTPETLPGQHDVAVLNLNSDTLARTIHIAPMQGDAQIRSASIAGLRLSPDGGVGVDIGNLSTYGRLFAGDLDGDQLDEILMLDQSPGGGRLRVARLDSASSSVKLVSEQLVGVDFAAVSAALVSDIDGDGISDVLVTGTDPTRQVRLAVLRGQAGGTLAAPQVLTPPQSDPPTAAPNLFTGPLCAQRLGAGTRVLVLGNTVTWQLSASPDGASLVPLTGLEDQGGDALACDDFDGDGVGDVALSSGSLIQVFRGQPVRP